MDERMHVVPCFAIWLALSCLADSAIADEMCDPALSVADDHPLGYRQRGDRCEGVYVRDVGGSLEIVSLTEYFAEFDPSEGDLVVRWATVGESPVRIRATSLQRKSYYRFDTVLSPGSSSYNWPTGLLAALTLARADLGVVAWTSISSDGADQAVYLPLRIGEEAAESTGFSVVLRSDYELSEVFVTLVALTADGEQMTLKNGEPLAYGYYPAQRPIRFQIDPPPDPGMYSLEIGVSLSGGGVATTSMVFELAPAL